MQRVPEPELMQDDEQVAAYAAADFAEPHEHFVALFRERFPRARPRQVLDLGCGPCDVTRRFARAYTGCHVVAIDGARAMLVEGGRRNAAGALDERIALVRAHLPASPLARRRFDAVISNSLLHHLPDPAILWQAVRDAAAPGALVLVMDLLRPESREAAAALVERHAAGAPDVLRRDFRHSLLAAYRPEEAREQLAAAGLGGLLVEPVSDRHWIAWGTVAARAETGRPSAPRGGR